MGMQVRSASTAQGPARDTHTQCDDKRHSDDSDSTQRQSWHDHLGLKIPISVPLSEKSSKMATSYLNNPVSTQNENSTDLETGRRPELKSEEFLFCRNKIDEIVSNLVEIMRR